MLNESKASRGSIISFRYGSRSSFTTLTQLVTRQIKWNISQRKFQSFYSETKWTTDVSQIAVSTSLKLEPLNAEAKIVIFVAH